MKITSIIILAAFLSVACSPEEDLGPPTQDEEGNPLIADYTGDELPRGIVPDGATFDEVELPIEQEGSDSGDPGITYAAVLAAYYLQRVQLPTGRFNYVYKINDGDFVDDDDSIHRQTGSTLTQAWAWRVTQRPEFGIATRSALEYLYGEVSEQDDGKLRLSNLGGTALLSIATSLYVLRSGTDEFDEKLEQLGQHILDRIDQEGEITEGGSLNLAQGQTLMALEHLHAATGDDRYLDALQLAVDWYVAHPDNHKHGKFFGLWANEPLTYLYDLRPDDGYAELAYGIADKIVDRQHEPGTADDKSWDGGFPSKNDTEKPTWNTCLQLEAVIDAYRMATLHGDEERAARYAQSAQWAAAFLMRLQLRAGETDDMPDPDLLIGAVPFTSTSKTIRIDVARHVAQALFKTSEYTQLEDFPGRRDADEISP